MKDSTWERKLGKSNRQRQTIEKFHHDILHLHYIIPTYIRIPLTISLNLSLVYVQLLQL